MPPVTPPSTQSASRQPPGQTHSARTASRKPKLYADLELELNAQLRALALAGGGGGGGKSRADSRTTVDFRRLQAFRNVFDAVIQNFSVRIASSLTDY